MGDRVLLMAAAPGTIVADHPITLRSPTEAQIASVRGEAGRAVLADRMKKNKKPTAIPVLPNARIGSIVGLLETLNEQGAKDRYLQAQRIAALRTE